MFFLSVAATFCETESSGLTVYEEYEMLPGGNIYPFPAFFQGNELPFL